MNNFKKGSKVRCVDNKDAHLKLGEIYTVLKEDPYWVFVETDSYPASRGGGGWASKRFELVNEASDETELLIAALTVLLDLLIARRAK